MDRIEDVLRAGESSDDVVLLLRGGEDTSAKLLRQAALLKTRYAYAGRPARGISLLRGTRSRRRACCPGVEAPRLPEVPARERPTGRRTRAAPANVPVAPLDGAVRVAERIGPIRGSAVTRHRFTLAFKLVTCMCCGI